MELTTADSGGNTAQNRENLTQNDAVNRENADAYSEKAMDPDHIQALHNTRLTSLL
jgi:hypothetical protein